MLREQPDDLRLWVEAGERRQAQDLNTATAAKVDQCVAAVEAFAASNTVILAPADELAAGTIEATPGLPPRGRSCPGDPHRRSARR